MTKVGNSATNRPNILFIITDHHAWHGHFTPGGIAPIQLPVWNDFCRQGTSFERAYCSAPICTPSRSSMMTGLYASAHGLMFNTDDRRFTLNFKSGQRLYNHYLEQQGYRNAYIGKWHCDYDRSPQDFGCEGWSLLEYGKIYMSDKYKEYASRNGWGDARAKIDCDINHPEWHGKTLTLHHENPWHFMNGCGILQGPTEAHEEQFVAQLCREKLRELAAGEQPFSLVAGFWGPHQAYFPSEEFAAKVNPKDIAQYPSFDQDLSARPSRYAWHRDLHHPGVKKYRDWSTWQTILARCYAQALQLDSAIGGILDELRELGIEDNTLVIWCADHGDTVASHGGMWDKSGTMPEEVMRIPLAIKWPGAFTGGVSKKELVSNLDTTATMLDAAGAAIPAEMHSRSLLPLCRGTSTDWKDELICEHHGHASTIVLSRMIVSGEYKYIAAETGGDELYNLMNDPFELSNLIDDPAHAEIRRDLYGRIVKHINAIGDRVAKEKLGIREM